MKTKKASKTNINSRAIFFAIALTYNLLLGLYLKDFLVNSPMLLTFYLLSALPTLLFVLKIRSTPMRAVVLIVRLYGFRELDGAFAPDKDYFITKIY